MPSAPTSGPFFFFRPQREMSVAAAWAEAFCLGCDKQTYGGLYCSRACQIKDNGCPSPASTHGHSRCDSSDLGDLSTLESPGPTSPGQLARPPFFHFEQHSASTTNRVEHGHSLLPSTYPVKHRRKRRSRPTQASETAFSKTARPPERFLRPGQTSNPALAAGDCAAQGITSPTDDSSIAGWCTWRNARVSSALEDEDLKSTSQSGPSRY